MGLTALFPLLFLALPSKSDVAERLGTSDPMNELFLLFTSADLSPSFVTAFFGCCVLHVILDLTLYFFCPVIVHPGVELAFYLTYITEFTSQNFNVP